MANHQYVQLIVNRSYKIYNPHLKCLVVKLNNIPFNNNILWDHDIVLDWGCNYHLLLLE